MDDRERLQRQIEAVHSFPDTYIFKVIGANEQDFVARVVQAAINALGGDGEMEVSTRESRAGRHVAVTLEADVENVESILDTYELLNTVQGVRFMV